MKLLRFLLFCVLATICSANVVPFAFFAQKASRTTYFGNCQSNGSPPALALSTDRYGAVMFYGTPAVSPSVVQKAMEFTCPGTGPQTLQSLELYAWTVGAGNMRMAIYSYADQSSDGGTIYDYTLNKVAEHSAAVSVTLGTAGTPVWQGGSQPLTGSTTLTGGKRYIIGIALENANVGYVYTTALGGVNTSLGGSYTGTGLPNPLTGGSSNDTTSLVFRVKVTGNGTASPAATREQFYVNTDFAGTSTGSQTNPYKKGQDVLVARCNKTFSLPIYVNLSGATDDDTAIDDSALGQFAPSSSNQLYFTGDRTSATWDSSAYTLAPSNRTTYYGVLNLHQPYVNFDRIQYDLPSLTAGQNNEILYVTHGVFSNSIIRAPVGTETTRYLSSVNPIGAPINGVKLINILAYGMSTGGSAGNGLKLHGRVYVYDSTIISGSGINGIDVAVDGNVDVTNTYVYAGLTNLDSVGTLTAVTTATSDSTGTGAAYRNIPVNSTTFSNPGSNDYRLGSGSLLRAANGGVGTDISGTDSRTATDLIGATRTIPWDIGALKY